MKGTKKTKDSLKRKYMTILKIRLPTVISENLEDAGIDAAESFSEIMEILFSIDPQIILEPWWDNETTKSIGKNDELPTCRQDLLKYVDKCFLRKDSYPYIKIIIRHNRNKSRFITMEVQDKYKSHKVYLSIAKIQQKQTVCIGWLMGTHPKSVNLIDLEEQIKVFKFQNEIDNNLKTPNLEIELRKQAIQINKEEKIYLKTTTRASHVYVAAKDKRTTFSRILRIFSNHNKVGFPLGQEIWFVPNVIDQRIPTTKSRVLNTAKMRERQRIFMEVMEIIPSYDIEALDTPVKDVEGNLITLRKAIMQMKLTEYPEYNLFRAVDQNVNTGRVYFLAHKNLLSEANVVVPILAKIVEEKYGSRIWNWFFPSAKENIKAIIGQKRKVYILKKTK